MFGEEKGVVFGVTTFMCAQKVGYVGVWFAICEDTSNGVYDIGLGLWRPTSCVWGVAMLVGVVWVVLIGGVVG